MGKFFLKVWEDPHKDITTSSISFRFERLELQWKNKGGENETISWNEKATSQVGMTK